MELLQNKIYFAKLSKMEYITYLHAGCIEILLQYGLGVIGVSVLSFYLTLTLSNGYKKGDIRTN